MKKTISIVIPVYNEAENIQLIYAALTDVCLKLSSYNYEFIFVNDGSTDTSAEIISRLLGDKRVKYIEFSRNFGKEMSTTAGLEAASGDAVIMIDADMQHPPALIPELISRWEKGAEVVAGVRIANHGGGLVKKTGSQLFYMLMRLISETSIESNETDFRILDRIVVDAFVSLPERERMTRSLINWLGFKKECFAFEAPPRLHGSAKYSFFKLVHLAVYSFVVNSLLPLRFTGYVGVAISFFSGVLGIIVLANKYVLGDPYGWDVSGSAQLAILNVFLIGLVLMALGVMALYIGTVANETRGRPFYVVRRKINFNEL